MEIDPRLHSRRVSSSESAESVSEYPEPPSRSSGQQLSSTILDPYTQSAQARYPGESSSNLRASPLNDTDPNDPNADARRLRACESCRQLKVRCEPDLSNPDKPCKRCAKAGRSCIVTVPNRKRQKKTDSRVTELERKIDVLTATLHATQKIDAILPSNNSTQSSSSREDGVGRRWLVPGRSSSDRSIPSRPAQMGNKRHHSGEIKDSRDTAALLTPSQASNPSPGSENADSAGRSFPAPWSTPRPNTRESPRGPDIVDRGLVSPAVALDAYTRYVDVMCQYIPMVVFPPGTQMSEVRRDKPVLFHAIVAVAVGPLEPSAQNTLLLELYKTIAERVIVNGEKSLDLVQALLVSCAFYTPPENFEEIKFYQLAQLAVAVGIDIGMYRKSKAIGKPFNFIRDFVKNAPVTAPDSPEIRRAWLGCYFVSVQTSSALRRPILVRWLPYMDECVEILENSPDALPSDKRMIHWAKLARIIEEISSRFFADDLGGPSFSEPRFQFTLKAFEKQLEQWRREALSDNDSVIMAQAQAIVNIYLHENAMILENSSEENTATDSDFSTPAAAARISSLSSTLASIHQAIDTVCSIPVSELISIPTVALARTAFALVALIKLYSIVTAPDSYIGQVIEPKVLKVELYLDRVIAHYTAAGSLAGGITPGKFSTVMSMLREWFKSRKDQHGDLKNALQVAQGGDPSASQQGRYKSTNLSQGNTPLQLLSEVATGEPNNQSSPNQQQYQQHPYQPDRTAQLPPLPACISPSELPSRLPTNTNSNTAAADSWAPYDSQRQFYQSSGPFDTTTTTSPNHQPPPASGYPDFSIPGSNPLMMGPGPMGMFPDLGLGLDEQFWGTMGYIGDMPFFPPQGNW
ncbi:hypothetical protein BJX76DRAFT_257323 [Aspergillus varians]